VLRDTLGMTGNEVWLRHRPVRRLHRVNRRRGDALLPGAGERRRQRKVTTIEGLAENGKLNKIQKPGWPATFPNAATARAA
jgi:hypothetical protein